MARIAKYSFDSQVTADDFVIGSDSVNKRTRNYRVGDLAAFFGASVPGRITYTYNQFSDYDQLSSAQISFGNNFQTDTKFTDVSVVYINPVNLRNEVITEYLQSLMDIGSLSISNGINFGNYRIIEIDTIQNGILELIVDLQVGNGTISDQEKVYLSANVKADSTHSTPELTGDVWQINHNLGKYPSVTVVDTANSVIYAEVSYTDKNNVTITFSSSVTGRAHLN